MLAKARAFNLLKFATLARNFSAMAKGQFPCSKADLQLDITLACGQSFRWKKLESEKWIGVMRGYLWLLHQDEESVYYEILNRDIDPAKSSKHTVRDHGDQGDSKHSEDYDQILQDYFQLDVNLQDLYEQWKQSDSNFKSKAVNFAGVRMLRQDPIENLFSFICSSNNHISRISGMVERMCEKFGDRITSDEEIDYYAFPSVNSLSGKNVEKQLRDLGFGYRAKYISESAKYIKKNHTDEWLYSLRDLPYPEARKELMKLCGVGSKVADCVCLMSLDKAGAIPVDTHVWQIAKRDYIPKLANSKSLTDSLYWEIGDHFRDLWGPYAGWAHSVLFSADLKKFQDSPKKRKNEDRASEKGVKRGKKKK